MRLRYGQPRRNHESDWRTSARYKSGKAARRIWPRSPLVPSLPRSAGCLYRRSQHRTLPPARKVFARMFVSMGMIGHERSRRTCREKGLFAHGIKNRCSNEKNMGACVRECMFDLQGAATTAFACWLHTLVVVVRLHIWLIHDYNDLGRRRWGSRGHGLGAHGEGWIGGSGQAASWLGRRGASDRGGARDG